MNPITTSQNASTHRVRRPLAGLLALVLCALCVVGLAGCGGSGTTSQAATSGDTSKSYKVCFVEIVENDAFVSMMEGFKAEMSAKGYTNVTYDVKNAQSDSSTLNQIASQLKTSDYDVIVPIATPAAQACANAEIEIPMVFISVTDPVSAGLMSSMDSPDKGITGTSNFSPVDEIYTFGTQLVPAAADKPVGILYCTGEKNAVVTAEKMESYLDSVGKAYVVKTITNSSEAQQAASSLAQDCGSIYVPMDSVVQSAMTAVTDTATQAGIPVFGSDPVMVKSGALVSVACSNETIGGYSADLAIKCLEGTSVADIPAMNVTDNEKVVSKATAEALGVTIPDGSDITIL